MLDIILQRPATLTLMRQTTIFPQDDDFEDTHQTDFENTGPPTVEISLRDLQEAALDDVISAMQATQLWLRFSAGSVPIRRTKIGPEPAPWHAQVTMSSRGPGFAFVNVPYYFGGLMGTLAVVLVPLIFWYGQHLLGLWPPGDSNSFRAYDTYINWRWIFLEFATLAAAAVMLWRYRLPFMVVPVAITVWYMSMDVASALMQNEGFDWEFSRDVSLVFGLGTVALAMGVDVRTRVSKDARWRQDFAFWLYLLGAIMFWGSLSLQDSGSEIRKFLYALVNIAMVFGGAAIGRRVLTVLGAVGVAGYLGYLSHRVFNNSMLFPFALTLLGLGVVALGVWWQRHEARINARLAQYVPVDLRPRA